MTLASISDAMAAPASPARRDPRKNWDLAIVALVFVAIAIPLDPQHLRHIADHIYWQNYADQSRYFASALAFERGDLNPVLHWYPLLYPLALAPFMGMPVFFAATLVDLGCYLLTYLGFREIARRFGVSGVWAPLLFVATTAVNGELSAAWAVPLTTTLSAAAIWLALARVGRFFDAGEPAPGHAELAATGALLGLIPLCRPADIALSALLGAFLLARVARSRDRLTEVGFLIGGGLAVAIPYGLLHLLIYGARATTYMRLSAAFGFDFANLGWKAQTLLVDAGPFFPGGAAIFERLPWLLLGLAGLLAAAIRPDGRNRALLLGAPALLYATIMLAYVDLVPTNIWSYGLIHYFKWIAPLLGLFAVDFVRSFAKSKAVSIAALAACVMATSLHYDAVTAAADEPAKLITFPGPRLDMFHFTGARTIITDRQGRLRNMFDYHQTLDDAGRAYAEAGRRDFAGDELWTDSAPDIDWPAVDPVTREYPPLVGMGGLAPLERFRPRWAFGLPCWIARYSCGSGRLELPSPGGEAPKM